MQVRLQPRYINTPQGRQQEGFTLSRDITVTSTDLETYDKVLDGVLKRGVDRIQQFNFISVGEGDAYQKALMRRSFCQRHVYVFTWPRAHRSAC